MEDIMMAIVDKKELLKKEEKVFNSLYPDWDEWLSNNHKKSYSKLVNRINTLKLEIEELEKQIKQWEWKTSKK